MAQAQLQILRRTPYGAAVLRDMARMRSEIGKLIDETKDVVFGVIRDMQDEVISRVLKDEDLITALADADPAVRQAAVRARFRDIEQIRANVYRDFISHGQIPFEEAAAVQNAFFGRVYGINRSVPGVAAAFARVDVRAVNTASRRVYDGIKSVSQDYRDAVRTIMVDAVKDEKGLTVKDMTDRIAAVERDRIITADNLNPDVAGMQVIARKAAIRAEMIARFEIMTITNRAFESKAESVLGKIGTVYWIWTNPNDDRTAPTHRLRIGFIRTKEEWAEEARRIDDTKMSLTHGLPALNPRCRCVLVPALERDFDADMWRNLRRPIGASPLRLAA